MSDELKVAFGFVDGTKCSCCGGVLLLEDAHWAFGKWWHRMAIDCQKQRLNPKENYEERLI